MEERRSIDDWQGRDPSDCPETFGDSTDNSPDWHLFVGLAILMLILFGGFYLMSKFL